MTGLVSQTASVVGISSHACRRIAASACRRYKRFALPKKGGGIRVVAQPAREVKALQRALVEILEPVLPIHEAATAYRSGASILENARRHKDARYLTKLDFSRFFPSIGDEAITLLLRSNVAGITDAEIRFVVSACMWRPEGISELCIGAPSSPLLSNAVMFSFDEAVQSHCESHGVQYTRYSDDIAISARVPDVLEPVEKWIRSYCAAMRFPRLVINETKRVAVGRGAAMRVTGLTLSNQAAVTVGRERKRGVRAGVKRYLTGELDAESFARLKGELAFVLSVEPEFRRVLVKTYGLRITPVLPRLKDQREE